METCSYCLHQINRLRISSFNCSCKYCNLCSNFIKSNQSFSSCLICESKFLSSKDSNKLTPNPYFRQENSTNDESSKSNLSKIEKDLQSELRIIEDSIKSTEKLLEDSEIFSTINKANKISFKAKNYLDSSIDIYKLMKFVKDFQIFKFNKNPVKNDGTFNFVSNYRNSLVKVSKIGLKREQQFIKRLEECLFLGNRLTIFEINYGITSIDFKVIFSDNSFLTAIGFGISPGHGNILILNEIVIFENKSVIFQKNTKYSALNDNNRLCNEFSLDSDIPLITGSNYTIATKYTGSYFYSIENNFMKVSNSKIHLEISPLLTSMIFYLRLK